jgi:hypothetical protein
MSHFDIFSIPTSVETEKKDGLLLPIFKEPFALV